MPAPAPTGGFSAYAKAEWKRWWESAVAPMWDDADVGSVEMLVWMVDRWLKEPTSARESQILRFKDTLGLTPKGRQDRRWLLPDEAPPQLSVIEGGKSTPRRLRAVEAS